MPPPQTIPSSAWYTQVRELAIILAETEPAIPLPDQIAQISNFLQRNARMNQVAARGYAITLVGYTAARPRSIIAEAAADPVGSWLEGIGLLDGWQKLVFQIAVGAVGVILILFGVMLIAGEATLNSAASKFGKSIGAGIRGKK